MKRADNNFRRVAEVKSCAWMNESWMDESCEGFVTSPICPERSQDIPKLQLPGNYPDYEAVPG
jgi:hypothetical protein